MRGDATLLGGPGAASRARPAGPGAVERIFLGWDRPALPAAAAVLAVRHEAGGAIDFGDAVVVLPGARAARRLLELLLEEAEARGARLLPPRLATVGQLPELLHDAGLPTAGPVLTRRLWIRALRSLPADALRTIVPERPADADLAAWHLLAGDVERIHHELAGAGLRFRDVAARFADPALAGEAAPAFLAYDDGARWAALAEAQRLYEAALAETGHADPELARLDALAAGAVGGDRPVWLVGVAELPPVTRRLVRAAAALGQPIRALVHAPAERAADFDDTGCILADAWAAAPVPLPEERLAVRDGPADQAAHVAATLAGLGGAYAADQITVAVPDEELVPYLERALGEAGIPVRYAAGRAVSRTGPYRLLAAIADYLDGEGYEAFATLLRHPDAGAWLAHHGERVAGEPIDPDACIADADAYHAERLPARLPRPRRSGAQDRLRPVEAALDALAGRSPHALLAPLRGGARPLREWAERILEVLARAYGGRPLVRERPDHRAVLEACERVRDVAAGYHRLPAELDEPCDAAAAIRVVLADVARHEVPPPADAAAVELLGWLELHLDDAPVKIVTGLNEPFLPASTHGDPLLPDRLRGALGLTDNRARRARDAYYLTALIRSTPELTAVAGRSDARGDPLRPSRLMLALSGRPLAERLRRFYGRGEGAPATAGGAAATPPEHSAAPAGAAPPAEPPATPGATAPAGAAGPASGDPRPATPVPAPSPAAPFALPPEPVIRLTEPVRRLAVSDFRALLADPYLFALQREYGLQPLDDEAREMDPLAFGTLAHDVLQAFALSPEVDGTDATAATRRLDALLDALARERFGRHALPAVRLQVEQLRARLHAFARWHASWIAEGWRVVAVEGQLRGEALSAPTPAALADPTPAPGTPHGGPAASGGTSGARDGAPPPAGRAPSIEVDFPVDGEPFTIRGRIDRIDYHAGRREWAVFDYKTSENATPPEKAHRKAKGWVDLQLPLYRHLLAGIRTPDGAPLVRGDVTVRLGYINLPRDLERTGAAFAAWTAEELAGADEVARNVIRLVRTGEFRHDPDAKAPYDARLAALLGKGQLAALEEDGETEESA